MIETVNFFAENKTILIIFHVFFVVVGMGSALISDILFNVYIKDKKINPTENRTLEVLSKVIWFSLAAIVLSGFSIFLSNPAKYIASDKFILKMIIVGVIIVNGWLFARITHGSLRKINFKDNDLSYKYVRIRKLSFAFGSISFVSWISTFILGSIKSIPVSLKSGIIFYVTIIFIGIIFSQIADFLVSKKKKEHHG